MELWKDVQGYEGCYQVSNFGRIKSLSRKALRKYGTYRNVRERILKPQIDTYLHVKLYKDGKGVSKPIHRMVAEAFLANPDKLPQINHKDENKHNNHLSNLEWCTAKYNGNYGTSSKRIARKLKKEVIQYDLDNNFIAEYESLKQLKAVKGFDSGLISCVCRGIYKQAYGYKFKYKEE